MRRPIASEPVLPISNRAIGICGAQQGRVSNPFKCSWSVIWARDNRPPMGAPNMRRLSRLTGRDFVSDPIGSVERLAP
jgi:hypothetical protein